jgi:hypothetical protein
MFWRSGQVYRCPSGETVPRLSGIQDTLYFGPGIYDLNLTPLSIASNEKVGLAAGAYVKGFLAFAPVAALDAAAKASYVKWG